MNLYLFVSVTFFVLPSLKTLAASLPFFKIFSIRLFQTAEYLNIFYLLKGTRTLDDSGGINIFDADFTNALEKQNTLFITKFSQTTCSFGGCSFPNHLNLEKYRVKIYFLFFFFA